MLRRLAGLIILGILGAGLASWLMAQPGTLQLDWFGWRLAMPTSLAAAILVVAMLLLLFLDRLIRGVLRLPVWLGRTVEQRRDASGHKALTLGLMAVSAGEVREAKKQAARAQRLLQAPQLTDLLSAQAAHLAGDHQAASRYFKSLTKDTDTAFLGHIGLARLAIDDNDKTKALSAARSAFELKPKSVMAAQQLFMLEADAHNWSTAARAVDLLLGDTANGQDELGRLRRQKTALFYLMAEDSVVPAKADMPEGATPPKEAIKALETAVASDPGFLPAVEMLGDFYLAQGAKRKAVKLFESGFKACPHQSIADRLKVAWNLNEGAYVARLIKLVEQVGSTKQSRATAHYIAAAQAFALGLSGEAHGQLDKIESHDRDAATWRLIAQIADHEDESESAAEALRQASDAQRAHSWQCDHCYSLQASWTGHCPDCGSFGALEWRRPGHVTPLGHIAKGPSDELGISG